MTEKKLEENLKIFSDQMEERLKNLPPNEQQQYLEGLVHAFDSINRYANPADLTPLELQRFISSAKSLAYSGTDSRGLDDGIYMRFLIESSGESDAKAYMFANSLQKLLGVPLTIHDKAGLSNILTIAGLSIKEKEV
ncbi:MAG: hypothetical protein PHH54_02750 [Candidatus Nanoarchaeia archaeon]|nr:hypothetical protein [Candidatus Nanoarchaeia archaeon]MDD5740879.1 hypothetical protein [Candidatus Nanoarchaeia archaeon]